MGAQAWRWRTFPGERIVVAAARTVTSTTRLLEVLPSLFRSDPRVDVVFAFDPTSAFGDGVHALLTAAGVRVMPWGQLSRTECHLLVSASENIDPGGVDCPVLVLPHGVGFHKLVPDSRGSGRRLSGVMDDERAWHAVSHPDQVRQLAEYHPSLAARTLTVGDPCYDRLLVSRGLRERYRAALGVECGQRLVVVSSTWGPQSLLGSEPGLPAELLAGLPLDEHRVAAIVHPNVWSAHSPWHVRSVEAAALDSGLLLIPPQQGWQAALLAADAVVGDHGSVTFYAAALGIPLLLAAFGEESVPGTPMSELGRIAPRLDPCAPLGAQLERAVAEHDAERLSKVAAGAFVAPGRALEMLRSAVHELLRLPERPSPRPPLHAFPLPVADGHREVMAVWMRTAVTKTDGEWTVSVSRLPAAAQPEEPEDPEEADDFRYLSCDEGEPDLRQLESALAITRRVPAGAVVSALRWARDTLDRYPGARLAAVPVRGGCLTALRDGRVVTSTATGPVTDPALLAAVVYACLRAGHALTGTVALRVGAREEDVALRVRPVGR